MANANDPQGIAAERGRLGTRLTALSASIAAYSGDANGLKDLQLLQADINYRLNALTTLGWSSTAPTGVGTAYNSFGLEHMAT